MSENGLMVVNNLAIMPIMALEQAVQRRDAVVEFVKSIMVKDVDFGEIPGTNKPTLLKPGAEKLSTFFGLTPRFEILDAVEDWTGKDHDGEPFFYYRYRCQLWHGDILAGEGIGSCNSWEAKYRFRNANIQCPNCGQETVIKGKSEFGGGWLCWQKRGGCGSKWNDGDAAIESQPRGKVPNPNPADLVNTVDKIAQKRSFVASTLITVNASEFFTQDVEDMDTSAFVDGSWMDTPRPEPEQPKATKKAPMPKTIDHDDIIIRKRAEFESAGEEAYGPDWKESARDNMVAFAAADFKTNGGTWKANIGKARVEDLTYSQLDKAVQKMLDERINKKA